MAEAIDTSGPRPWPGTATIDDIRPGAIITQVNINDLGRVVYTIKHIVVSQVSGILDYFYVITPEQADRFTAKEITSGKLDGLGVKKDLQTMGIAEGTRWMLYTYCIFEGMMPERRTTPRHPFEPIELPRRINPDGLERFLSELAGDSDHSGFRAFIEQHGPRKGLKLLLAKSDDRGVTALILRFGLHGEAPLNYAAVGRKLNLKPTRTREIIYRVEAQMRGVARNS